MSWPNNFKRYFIVIFDPHARTEPMATELSSIFLGTQRAGKGGCDVTGRVKKSWFSKNTVSISNKLTYCILKTLDSNIFSDIYSINTPFKCLQFPACDVTAWTRELKHWTSTWENWDVKVLITLKIFKVESWNLEYGLRTSWGSQTHTH